MNWLTITTIVGALGGCTSGPTWTGTECPIPDPMTLGYTAALTPGCTGSAGDCNFGKTFMDTYCVNCHTFGLKPSMRNGAPFLHDFDSLYGVMEIDTQPNNHIDMQAGFGPDAHNTFMPGAGTNGRCPSVVGGSLDEPCPLPTDEERTKLAVWIACERGRVHDFTDAGVDGP